MTKWARMRRRKERMKAKVSEDSVSEENEPKLVEPKKDSENIKHYEQNQKTEQTSSSNTILSQIPRYVYLVAIFALLSGIFFPLITIGAEDSLGFVIGGVAILFLGLAGCIVIFKTIAKKQVFSLVIGFALIAISLTLIFLIQNWWQQEFYRI